MSPHLSANVSKAHRQRYRALTAVFIIVQALIVALTWIAFDVVDIARAYISGESSYAKAQKEAVISLQQYAASDDPTHFAAFERSLAAAAGARLAREALQKRRPDYAAAARGFVQTGVHPSDTYGMSVAFHALQKWRPIAAAIVVWRKADARVEDLARVGKDMREAVESGSARSVRARLAERAKTIDTELSKLERDFSKRMRDVAKSVSDIALTLLFVGSTTLVWLGLRVTRHISRNAAANDARAALSEQRFRDFAEVASDWFCELDRDLRIVYLSDRFQYATGVPSANVVGQHWQEVASRRWLRIQTPSHFSDLAGQRPFRGHILEYLAPDGRQRFWSLAGSPIFDAAGHFAGYRATGSEVTEMMQANRALAMAKEMAEQGNRSKSSFLANMSHELRTPLNAIIGFSETMKGELFGPLGGERYLEYSAGIHSSGRHLLSLINDILDLSRVEAGKLELQEDNFFLSEIVDAALVLCRERAERAEVKMEIHLPTPSPEIIGDPLRLKQVLINLISNAVKFTPAGGKVQITARIASEGALVIQVADSGIGMTAEDLEVALKPFGQVDHGLNRRYEGTGLGLPLAKTLVELHGGSFAITSERSLGTTVTAVFPPERVRSLSPHAADALPLQAAAFR